LGKRHREHAWIADRRAMTTAGNERANQARDAPTAKGAASLGRSVNRCCLTPTESHLTPHLTPIDYAEVEDFVLFEVFERFCVRQTSNFAASSSASLRQFGNRPACNCW
jgi:hypothetical protein